MKYTTTIFWHDQKKETPPENVWLWISDLEDDIYDAKWNGYSWLVDGFGTSTKFENVWWAYHEKPMRTIYP